MTMMKFSRDENRGGYDIKIRLWTATITVVILLFATFASVLGTYYKLSARVDTRHIIDQNMIEDIRAIKTTQTEWTAALHKIEIHLGKIDTKLEMMEK